MKVVLMEVFHESSFHGNFHGSSRGNLPESFFCTEASAKDSVDDSMKITSTEASMEVATVQTSTKA